MTTSVTDFVRDTKPVERRCVFCLNTQEIKRSQVLLDGQHLYLCAPRGQLIEGYLVIAPYVCIGSLSLLSPECLDELDRLKAVVSNFYRSAYGITEATVYEQGRGGAGDRTDPAGGFPLHAHLCCLPVAVDLHAILGPRYEPLNVRDLWGLRSVAGGRPYVYAEARDASGVFRAAAYVGRSAESDVALRRERLKPEIAGALGVPDRGDWRVYPGDAEVSRVVERFTRFWRTVSE